MWKNDLVKNCRVHPTHWFSTQVPPLKGLADFKGRVIHAHSFRDAQDFKGQRLLLIGNGYSGEDIAMQCVKFGAARATIGFRTAAAGHDFQACMRRLCDTRT